MRTALITSVYGRYDRLVDPLEQYGDVEYIAVVDEPHDDVEIWRQIVEPRPNMHPRMAAKVAKVRPDLYTDAPVAVWVDGSTRIRRPDFVLWCAQLVMSPGAAEWLQFAHPVRDCIYAEADASLDLGKYAEQPIVDQVDAYRKLGMPERWGLWAAGVIVRRHPADTRDIADRWLVEQMRWTYQDQLSEPFVWWQVGQRPGVLPGNLWANEWVSFAGHDGGDR